MRPVKKLDPSDLKPSELRIAARKIARVSEDQREQAIEEWRNDIGDAQVSADLEPALRELVEWEAKEILI